MKIFLHRALLAVSGIVLAISATVTVCSATNTPVNRTQAATARRPNAVPAAIIRAPHAQPAIFRIVLPTEEVHSGQTVHAAVLTSSNVASVEARIKGMGMNLTRAGVGKFTLTYQVPWLPFFFRGDWPVNVIARNVDGVRAERTLKIKFQ